MLERLKYLDNKFPNAWNRNGRLELIVQIEGEGVRERLSKNMSQDLKYLVATGVYVPIRYNNNKRWQFYLRPEWINYEEGVKSIKPEFAPNAKDLADIPAYQHKNIIWVPREV